MKRLSSSEFDCLCQQDNIITIKRMKDQRPRILETKTGLIIKIMHARKTWFSAYKNKRAALRFYENGKKLAQQGISAPQVEAIFYCPERKNCIVTYKKLNGKSLRTLYGAGPLNLADLAVFIAKLHELGIFFRSFHLDNVLLAPDGHFALIDISEFRFKKKPLNFFVRYRNLRHAFTIKHDKAFWKPLRMAFLGLYCSNTNLSPLAKWSLRWFMQKAVK